MNARMEEIDAMAIRRETAEHPFSAIKAGMGATHFLCKGLAVHNFRQETIAHPLPDADDHLPETGGRHEIHSG
jgi:hypothetical protein